MMTLDDAIAHHDWAKLASEGQVSEEHWQYAQWLKELKVLRAARDDIGKSEWDAIRERERLRDENARMRRKFEILKAHGIEIVDARAGGFEIYSDDYARANTLERENARYRELVEILRRDWLIEASWDGLRKFWYVGLTEDGVRERDERDAKLRELIRTMWFLLCVTGNDDLVAEVEKNGETMWKVDATAIAETMCELGVEADE